MIKYVLEKIKVKKNKIRQIIKPEAKNYTQIKSFSKVLYS